MLSSGENSTFAYAITIDDRAVGSIGAFRQGNIHRQTAEQGYYLAEEYWGRGIMTDAIRQLCGIILETISPERIEKIENERSLPYPDEVLVMADRYKQPSLCNFYCANQCPIGREYVPEVKIKDLAQIVLEMLASLNTMQKEKDRLIEITADGQITGDEIRDFIHIQEELEQISIAVETLQLWSERMLATGAIDPELYRSYKGE